MSRSDEQLNILAGSRIAAAFWERDLVAENIRKGRVAILALERRRAEHHLVYQNTQGPPIDSTRVTTPLDDLGCNVLFGPNE